MIQADTLSVEYGVGEGFVRALDGATLHVEQAEVLGIVGESGSGKSTLAMAIGRLLPANAKCVEGDLRVEGCSVFGLDDSQLHDLRRRVLGFVFQNPIAALDPTKRVGKQLALATDIESPVDLRGLLARVELPDPEEVMSKYPHELSGGMAQRVAIAMAIARKPRVLIADEPTAALDASIRTAILDLLLEVSSREGMAMVLATHDLHSVARYCQRVSVMYAGRIMEQGDSERVFTRPLHPYSRALLHSLPGQEGEGGRIEPIPGSPPMLGRASDSCAFAPRCRWAAEICRTIRPERRIVYGRPLLCHRVEEIENGASGRDD